MPANANARVVRVTVTLTPDQASALERFVQAAEIADRESELSWAIARLFVALQVANSAR